MQQFAFEILTRLKLQQCTHFCIGSLGQGSAANA
jgi:hypothetical protein